MRLIEISRQMAFNIAIVIIFMLIIVGQTYYINKDYTEKVLQVNADLAAMENELTNVLLNLTDEVIEQRVLFNSMISTLRDDNLKNFNSLQGLIKDVETQSNIQLTEIKEDISNIKVSSADFTEIIEDVIDSVVSVITNVGQGSGVFIRSDGFLVTNYHVIEGASGANIYTYEKKTYGAIFIGADIENDIAVLKIDRDFPFLKFSDPDDFVAGQKVIALGNPGGLDFTVTEGIISAPDRMINGKEFVQTDVPINPGNSGGPLVDIHKEIVGLNNFKLGGNFEGIGFAIPSDRVRKSVNEIISAYEELLAQQEQEQ